MNAGDQFAQQDIVTPQQLELVLQIQKNKPQPKLGIALLQENIITHKHLNAALQKQTQDRHTPLGEIFVGMGVVTEPVIKRVLSKKFGIPTLRLRDFQVDSEAIQSIPAALAHKHKAVPLYRTESRLIVAMEDPLARESLLDLELCVQLKIDPILASHEDMVFLLRRFYSTTAKRADEFSGPSSEREVDLAWAETIAEDSVSEEEGAAIHQMINKVILDASAQGASEIHMESIRDGAQPSKIRFRKDGLMMPYSDIPADFRATVIARIKSISGLDVAQKRRSQRGRLTFEQGGASKIELRVVTVPTMDGLEDIVIRVLSTPKALSIDGLNLAAPTNDALKKLVAKSSGLLLVCGPTGSGKTTMLHALLAHINTPNRKIWTVEDPVEIKQEGIRQIQIDSKSDWTFASALRSLADAGPDVVMVSDMRDAGTAQAAMDIALTGRSVLSGMHATGAAEGVARLLDFGVDPFHFVDMLQGVVGQRLIRGLCPACRQSRVASNEELETLAREYCAHTTLDPAHVIERWRQQYGDANGALTLFSATGCEKCGHMGYQGRIGIYELLPMSAAMKRKIYARANADEMRHTAISEGMQTIKQDGIEKVLQGKTDMEQVRSAC